MVAKVSVSILGPIGTTKLVNCTTSLAPASVVPLREKPKRLKNTLTDLTLVEKIRLKMAPAQFKV